MPAVVVPSPQLIDALKSLVAAAGSVLVKVATRTLESGCPSTVVIGAPPVTPDALSAAVSGDEVEYVVGLPGDGHETEVFFSDLSHEYVTINADYTT